MNGILKIVIGNRTVDLELCEPGYYGGETDVRSTAGTVSMHVEAIQVTDSDTRTEARNDTYQSVIDNWLIRNEGCMPKLLTIGGKKYFINVEVFAS